MWCVLYEMYSSVPMVHLSQLGFFGELSSQEKLKLIQSILGLTCDWNLVNSSMQWYLSGTWAVSLLQTSTELERDACSMCTSPGPQSFRSENLVCDKIYEIQVIKWKRRKSNTVSWNGLCFQQQLLSSLTISVLVGESEQLLWLYKQQPFHSVAITIETIDLPCMLWKTPEILSFWMLLKTSRTG